MVIIINEKQKALVKRQVLIASFAIGAIAAVSVFFACTFGTCPSYLDSLQYALIFFVIGTAVSYLIKRAVLL